VRTTVAKGIARKLAAAAQLKGGPITDFDEAKKLVAEQTTIKAKHLRNRIAGYLIRLSKAAKPKSVEGGEGGGQQGS